MRQPQYTLSNRLTAELKDKLSAYAIAHNLSVNKAICNLIKRTHIKKVVGAKL